MNTPELLKERRRLAAQRYRERKKRRAEAGEVSEDEVLHSFGSLLTTTTVHASEPQPQGAVPLPISIANCLPWEVPMPATTGPVPIPQGPTPPQAPAGTQQAFQMPLPPLVPLPSLSLPLLQHPLPFQPPPPPRAPMVDQAKVARFFKPQLGPTAHQLLTRELIDQVAQYKNEVRHRRVLLDGI
ncbi:hypothetical protein PAPYR_11875 [Paratrimastix pyriformis]|uniref:Uncharacterized protein n=1 Tax=Paratrimastix pyriformis TaxID=342808 RepID=A0ABQ8U5B8_9EUKA|nr:hypothetical protein PAPYR_11875 [Paratrimastix pyriformis]